MNDCIVYRYIACGTVAKDSTFYASLCASIVLENIQVTKKDVQNDLTSKGLNNNAPIADNSAICDSNNDNVEYISACIVAIEDFFQHIIDSIKNNHQLLAGLEYFKKGYEKVESLSDEKLASHLYQQNSTAKTESV
ncbi:2936_t:CDS:2 [Cetraspora pellucida]|uniref:2936_t:CDS:1 n=1 Tax=Cetraspora pellucida TaxID=1433469 RepID=A0ACA9LSQ2_9GLOM|nr:2936_t:CDS:2 [Cetraspora pellucida]